MTDREIELYNELSNLDNLDVAQGATTSKNVNASLLNIKGNLPFKVQFDLNFSIKYYKNTSEIAPSALDNSLKNTLFIPVFGLSDYYSGYANFVRNISLSGWNVANVRGIYGFNYGSASTFLITGEFGFNYLSTIGTDTYTAVVKISCPQVAYGTLLSGLVSDIFTMNMIRYVVPTGYETQLGNAFTLVNQSMFGKRTNDTISPNTYITGETYNKNIADIPLQLTVDKNVEFIVPVNYDCTSFSWVITASSFKRLKI